MEKSLSTDEENNYLNLFIFYVKVKAEPRRVERKLKNPVTKKISSIF